ncbi:MAG: ABC transporter permease [Acidobacteriota bacterium]
MQSFRQDVRFALRVLLKNPLFTLVATIALALGIGANTAIFSVVNAVLIQALPYKNADQLAIVWEHNFKRGRDQNVVSPANYLDWKEQNRVFEDMAVFIDQPVNLVGGGDPEEIIAQYASPNFFSLLGVNAERGRVFSLDDGTDGQPAVAILTHGLWQRRFGGDANIVGQTISLNQRDCQVIGVLPENFQWFIKSGSITGKPAELFLPYVLPEQARVRRGRYLSSVARLKPDVSIEQAQSEMTAIAQGLEAQYNDFNANWGINVVPLRKQLSGEIRPALLILAGAVFFVLLIACANVANLLLARASTRQKEIAIRKALGASRWQITRQLLTESLVLSLIGGILGLWLAIWSKDSLIALAPPNLLSVQNVKLDVWTLGFSLVISLLTGLIFGLIPAYESSRDNFQETLKEGGKNIGGTSRTHRLRSAFVVAEMALALVLLIGAGLLMKSLGRLQTVDPGFQTANLLTMRVMLPASKYPQDNQRTGFFNQALERLRNLPGVQSAGAINALPFVQPPAGTKFEIEGQPKAVVGQEPITKVCVTDKNYFDTMRIPLRSGRFFNEQENTQVRHVVIINEKLAETYFPGENPLGKRITIAMKNENLPTEIIGVVGDVRYMNLNSESEPMVYWPHPELTYSSMNFVIRTQNDPLNLAGAARAVIGELDADQPVADVRTMESIVGNTLVSARFNMLLLSIFSMLALVLACVGIYGVMSYAVTQRTHEIGIRMALGAQTRDVLRMIIKEGLSLALLGTLIGLVSAYGLTRLMTKLLFEVSSTDFVTFIIVPLILTGVALVACLVPARRAAKTDPMVALRYD